MGAWDFDGFSLTAEITQTGTQMVDTFANYFSQNDLKILSDKENGIHAKLDCVFAALSEPAHGMNFWKLYHVVLFHKITVTTPAKYQFKRAEVSPEE